MVDLVAPIDGKNSVRDIKAQNLVETIKTENPVKPIRSQNSVQPVRRVPSRHPIYGRPKPEASNISILILGFIFWPIALVVMIASNSLANTRKP